MTDKEKQNKDVKGEGTQPETEEDTVRMFKDDFDAMQAEADQLATELGRTERLTYWKRSCLYWMR